MFFIFEVVHIADDLRQAWDAFANKSATVTMRTCIRHCSKSPALKYAIKKLNSSLHRWKRYYAAFRIPLTAVIQTQIARKIHFEVE
jgi:hypothetical protein